MTQTGLQSHLYNLRANNSSSKRSKPSLTFYNECSARTLWYLDFDAKALPFISSVRFSEALGDLGGLVHSQEPVVTVVDVHDRPQVTDIGLRCLALLILLLCRHGGCYRCHGVEDER